MTESTITREFYEAFQRVEFHRWDAIVAENILINSPAVFGARGLPALKDFAMQFTDLGYRIDLVDEHVALDAQGAGRGFLTWCLNWKHTKAFGGLAPTGREGTAVQTLLFTISGNEITRIDLADNTLDLAIYEWERGRPIQRNVHPEPIVTGVDRRPAPAVAREPVS